MIRRAVLGSLVSLAMASGVAGQFMDTPAQLLAASRIAIERNVVAMLRSRDWTAIAWAGFLAAELRLTACIPELRKALARSAGGDPVAIAPLDALIRTNAVVPGEELAPFLSFRAPTIVLLSRRADANRALLLRAFHSGLRDRTGTGASGCVPVAVSRWAAL
jgi:hypothetical protein